jgi:hypothetical protein
VAVRESLHYSRCWLGLDFDTAWPTAVEEATRGLPRRDRREWLVALEWAEPAFRVAYEERATVCELAAMVE